jgi:uroporphyrinogen III methyltransferase/synthase
MVTFITGHEDPNKEESAIDWKVLAANPGTLVFLMGVKNLDNISTSLIKAGKPSQTPAALVRWGTTPQQVAVVSSLQEIPAEAKRRGITAPAVLVVGSVANLHDTLGWFEKKPLFGKRILITRSREQSKKMSEKISDQGGEPVIFPTIRIQPPDDFTAIDDAIARIGTFDWVVFTSVNGVEKFFERFFQLKDDIRAMTGPRIAAIGPVTAAAIRRLGLKVDLLAKEFVAEGLLDVLSESDVRGKRFLIPRAEKAREILPEGLTKMGGEVEVVAVYKTGLPPDADIKKVRKMLEEKELDAVTFTSSSTVTHLVEMLKSSNLPGLLDGVVLASIGPVTSSTLKERGLPVHVEADEYTIDGLLEALVVHFESMAR